MRCRGPDGEGIYHGSLGASPVTLLHSRLAIIDLDPRANQPFQRGNHALVFNGEIYNYLELSRTLVGLGVHLSTQSDTEVLCAAYETWGFGFLDKLEGMWAFALFDRDNQQLILSRDRFGEKPLYVMEHKGCLWFGSQIDFLASLSGHKPDIDDDQIRRFLINGYKSLYKRPRTFFKGVSEIQPATSLVLSPRAEPQVHRYWHLAYRPKSMTKAEVVEGTREHLSHAIRLRLRSDVPVALCLSGGVDSGAIASVIVKDLGRPLETFSIIEEDPRYDELANIRATAGSLGCQPHLVPTPQVAFLDRLADLINYRKSPVATLTYYLHSFLIEALADAGYKVTLSGTGADELFSGYYDHYGFWLAGQSERSDLPDLIREWHESYGAYVRNPLLQDPRAFIDAPDERRHIFLNSDIFTTFLVDEFAESFEETTYTDDLLRNRMMNELFHESVPVILHEEDLNAMQRSVENRAPYLDRNLCEFLYTVPSEHLINAGYAKWPLRASVEGILTDSVRLDKRKRGFNAPVESLLNLRDHQTKDLLLASSPAFDLVKREAIETILQQSDLTNSFSKFLFSFISVKLFLEDYARWSP